MPGAFWASSSSTISPRTLDVSCPEDQAEALVEAWRREARRILEALDWSGEQLAVRLFPGGANLAMSAPVDVLYAATEVNEWAFAAARAQFDGSRCPALDEEVAKLRSVIHDERNPALLRLRHAAREHRVAFLSDDEQASVGLGCGSQTFPVDRLPDPDQLDWSGIHDIPLALITGTNGKSTTVRLIASMIHTAGKVPGITSTDGIQVGDELVEGGDYSGPSGARAVLRDRRVEVAVLECARGGMLRRGLGVRKANVSLVTNVGKDHLGEFGVADPETLLETKLVVRRALGPRGVLVLNADDPGLRSRGESLSVPIAWFTRESGDSLVRGHVETGGQAALVEDGAFVFYREGQREEVAPVEKVPITLGGAAIHNVANVLAATIVGRQLDLDPRAIVSGLCEFQGSAQENPGRGNLFEVGGVRILVDFAHNPHAFRSLMEMARRLEPKRLLVLVGQAGDRDDASIRELARATWEGRPDRIILKEMPAYLRGRQPGEVLDLMQDEFSRLGVPADRLERAATEMDGAQSALRSAQPGDLLYLFAHEDRARLLALVSSLSSHDWKPGRKLPEE